MTLTKEIIQQIEIWKSEAESAGDGPLSDLLKGFQGQMKEEGYCFKCPKCEEVVEGDAQKDEDGNLMPCDGCLEHQSYRYSVEQDYLTK